MQIIKRDGEVMEFDISKIVAAITKAIQDVADGITEMAREYMDAAHEVAHSVLSFFAAMFGCSSKKRALTCFIYATALLVPALKHIIINFLEHASETRKLFLITKHHRGNTDDTDFSFSM